MGSLLATALGLGVAGVDPAGALIAVAALAAGARDRVVLGYGAVVLVGTAVLGAVLSLTVGSTVAEVDWSVLVPSGRGGAVLELVVGALVLAWGMVRLVRRGARTPRPRRTATGAARLLGVGAVFALSAVLDPTFLALTVLAGRGQDVVAVVLAHLLWAVVSQAPLVLLLVAVARGGHQRAVERFRTWWARAQPGLRRVGTAALLLIGAVLVLDAAWWFATGGFLLPEP
ncbi:hypothetical protein [Quadrisphaera sp. DSM 44207]|uniref:hypothetical protein n=1 Tax=Quadrisphaera sp. DSM 44207 TaxID=1881057 RepID=UPI00088E2D84|nr:hypothetical protein [Quadrisphaera sp. DSM 44207]SDQ19480.1 hypothetical protein SAMN05428996_1024 [Quadrisphaera sp. DSM 44207]